jgi:hypothetical protein
VVMITHSLPKWRWSQFKDLALTFVWKIFQNDAYLMKYTEKTPCNAISLLLISFVNYIFAGARNMQKDTCKMKNCRKHIWRVFTLKRDWDNIKVMDNVNWCVFLDIFLHPFPGIEINSFQWTQLTRLHGFTWCWKQSQLLKCHGF